MSDECFIYERRGPVAVITIDDPPYNRMSLSFMDVLEPVVDTIATDVRELRPN
jgi:enoyl-CoA hydratase/carnithine racemase